MHIWASQQGHDYPYPFLDQGAVHVLFYGVGSKELSVSHSMGWF